MIVSTQEIEFTDDEVVDFEWLSVDELRDFVNTETNYCSPLPLVFAKAEKFRKEHFNN